MKSHAFHVEQTVPPPSACRKHAPLCAYRCHSKSPGVTLTRGHSRRRSVVSATPCSPSGTCTGYTHTQAHSSRHRLEEGNGVGQQFHIPDTCTLAHSHASHGHGHGSWRCEDALLFHRNTVSHMDMLMHALDTRSNSQQRDRDYRARNNQIFD